MRGKVCSPGHHMSMTRVWIFQSFPFHWRISLSFIGKFQSQCKWLDGLLRAQSSGRCVESGKKELSGRGILTQIPLYTRTHSHTPKNVRRLLLFLWAGHGRVQIAFELPPHFFRYCPQTAIVTSSRPIHFLVSHTATHLITRNPIGRWVDVVSL